MLQIEANCNYFIQLQMKSPNHQGNCMTDIIFFMTYATELGVDLEYGNFSLISSFSLVSFCFISSQCQQLLICSRTSTSRFFSSSPSSNSCKCTNVSLQSINYQSFIELLGVNEQDQLIIPIQSILYPFSFA